MFSNLAYGAQGIQYFTYVTPTAYGQNNFHHAPLAYGTYQRTEVFDYIKEVNQEIASLSPVFLNSKVVSVAHTGERIPPGTQRLGKLPDVIHNFETQGEGAVTTVAGCCSGRGGEGGKPLTKNRLAAISPTNKMCLIDGLAVNTMWKHKIFVAKGQMAFRLDKSHATSPF